MGPGSTRRLANGALAIATLACVAGEAAAQGAADPCRRIRAIVAAASEANPFSSIPPSARGPDQVIAPATRRPDGTMQPARTLPTLIAYWPGAARCGISRRTFPRAVASYACDWFPDTPGEAAARYDSLAREVRACLRVAGERVQGQDRWLRFRVGPQAVPVSIEVLSDSVRATFRVTQAGME